MWYGPFVETPDIGRCRLASQRIVGSDFTDPAEVVAHLGALQAQDYAAVLWAIGLRLQEGVRSDVERAIAERKIVRTWPMRGTLHFVAAPDVRWMLRLLAPRSIAASATRYRAVGLDDATVTRGADLIVRALEGGEPLTRDAVYAALDRGGISTAEQRGYLLLWRLASEGVICFGPHRAGKPTFVLLDAWIGGGGEFSGDEALAELARRYFRSHGPATVRDFAWWTGLPLGDARTGIAASAPALICDTIDGTAYWMAPEALDAPPHGRSVHLLAGFDEYLLGYTDRSAVLDPIHAVMIVPGRNGVFQPTIVVDGQVRGTWKRSGGKSKAMVTPLFFDPMPEGHDEALPLAIERYARFSA